MTYSKNDWIDHVLERESSGVLEITSAELLPPGAHVVVQPERLVAVFDRERRHAIASDGNVVLDVDSTLECEDDPSEEGEVAVYISVDSGTAVHKRFVLPESLWGHGIAGKRLEDAVELYRGLGIEAIRLRAENYGKYAWAALGFEFATEDSREEVNTQVSRFAEELGIDLEGRWFGSTQDIVDLNVAGEEEGTGRILLNVVDVDHVWDVLERRYDGERLFWPPPKPEGDLRLGQALLLYADYDGWDGVFLIS